MYSVNFSFHKIYTTQFIKYCFHNKQFKSTKPSSNIIQYIFRPPIGFRRANDEDLYSALPNDR